MNRGIIVGIERLEKYPDIVFLHVEYDSIYCEGKSTARVKCIGIPAVLGDIVNFIFTYDKHGKGYYLASYIE